MLGNNYVSAIFLSFHNLSAITSGGGYSDCLDCAYKFPPSEGMVHRRGFFFIDGGGLSSSYSITFYF